MAAEIIASHALMDRIARYISSEDKRFSLSFFSVFKTLY